jgi:hypothetical protein
LAFGSSLFSPPFTLKLIFLKQMFNIKLLFFGGGLNAKKEEEERRRKGGGKGGGKVIEVKVKNLAESR